MKKLLLYIFIIGYSYPITAQNVPLSKFESSFLFRNKYPAGLQSVDWFPDDWEVQGVTNDGRSWFFTIVDQDKTQAVLWKIPKNIALQGNVGGNAGVIKKSYFESDLSEIRSLNAWHWGDLDHYKYNGVDYILVPVNSTPAIVICFRASNLSYVNYGILDSRVEPGWCAIGIDSNLYTSANNAGFITQYKVDWARLTNTNQHNCFTYKTDYVLRNSDGTLAYLTDLQGGEFTESGELLYLISGRGYCAGNGAPWTPMDGIHAIETNNWTRLKQSVKNSNLAEYFNYDYDPTCSFCLTGGGTDTPEGLTIWDLEDDSDPNIRGSLHVLHDHYTNGGTGCDDELFFHHFSSNIIIDKNNGKDPPTFPRTGTSENPFASFNIAYNYYPIWNGANMILKAGTYPEKGRYIKRIRIKSEGGTAVIGKF